MTVNDFRKSLGTDKPPAKPEERECAIGPDGRGCTATSIARKAMRATQLIGIVGGEARLPGATGCVTAQHRQSFARISALW
jgi:hypothetical protein